MRMHEAHERASEAWQKVRNGQRYRQRRQSSASGSGSESSPRIGLDRTDLSFLEAEAVDTDCTSLYGNPAANANITAYDPYSITWDCACLSGTTGGSAGSSS